MRVKKIIFWVLLVITVLSVGLIIGCDENAYIVNIAMGILSGNIVAIILTIVEYFHEKDKLLNNFFEEALYLSDRISSRIKLFEFGNFYWEIKKADSDEERNRIIEEVIDSQSNLLIIEDIMQSFVSLKEELSTRQLSKYYLRYSGFLDIRRKRKDKQVNELYAIYSDFHEFIDKLSKITVYFESYFKNMNGNTYFVILILMELFRYNYDYQEQKRFINTYDDWVTDLELLIDVL